jgi:uncharacterized protein YdeI (YjbR/CyaY-like superfamily)
VRRHKTVDEFLAAELNWKQELAKLRGILIRTGLQETIKWGAPTYTHAGKNVVGIGSFKSYFGLWFFQGALRNDAEGVLINAQEGKTRALRQWRMNSAKNIRANTIKSYVRQAIQLVEQGKELRPRTGRPIVVPEELTFALKKHKKAISQFKDLTPGKQREFADYISQAKRAETKRSRIEKILPMICAGVGLNDRYRKS